MKEEGGRMIEESKKCLVRVYFILNINCRVKLLSKKWAKIKSAVEIQLTINV